ncbi:MAG: flagellar hook-basal body protein [Phycisphaerae bacterium]|nr:flagellar hook-basal body protein [Phycisphaerae bacterium]
MLYGLYISAGGMKANDYKMAVGTNNLANVNTVGFKIDSVIVEPRPRAAGSRPGDPKEMAGLGGGVWARRSVTSFAAGPLEATDSPFDVALNTGATADGFLSIQGKDGKQQWTRDGRLTLDPTGKLITQTSGLTVLDSTGKPITLDPADGPVSIDQAGNIRQSENEIATLGLASFSHPERLVKLGACQFAAASDMKPEAFRGQVAQGHVETSAAEPTSLLAQMILVQRAYEANANMIRLQDTTLGRAVNDVGKI